MAAAIDIANIRRMSVFPPEKDRLFRRSLSRIL
jgi:hypothetical protein